MFRNVFLSLNLFYSRFWIWIVSGEEFFIDFFFFFISLKELMNIVYLDMNIEMKGISVRLQRAPKGYYKNGFVELLYFFWPTLSFLAKIKNMLGEKCIRCIQEQNTIDDFYGICMENRWKKFIIHRNGIWFVGFVAA